VTEAFQQGAFWDWAVKVYAAPGVAERCLELQDDQDQCVPLLLWGLWLAQGGVSLNTDQAEAGAEVARAYLEHVITPLRNLRRKLKNPVSDVEDVHRLPLREGVKTLELNAEAALMQALTGLVVREADTKLVDSMINLVTLSRAWSAVVPRAHLSVLNQLVLSLI
jgi:uncharacterized protein (TIGR02444 family)